MANSLFKALGPASPNMGGMGGMIQQFQQFRRTFSGDPRAQVQQMLNTGKVTQAQYDRAVQMANQLQGMMKGMF